MELLIVTGMSGSGKSCVMDVMEDIGYYCIDNLPPKLIPQFVDLCRKSESEIKKIAVAFDIRTGDMFAEIFHAWQEIKSDKTIQSKIVRATKCSSSVTRKLGADIRCMISSTGICTRR